MEDENRPLARGQAFDQLAQAGIAVGGGPLDMDRRERAEAVGAAVAIHAAVDRDPDDPRVEGPWVPQAVVARAAGEVGVLDDILPLVAIDQRRADGHEPAADHREAIVVVRRSVALCAGCIRVSSMTSTRLASTHHGRAGGSKWHIGSRAESAGAAGSVGSSPTLDAKPVAWFGGRC